MTMQTWMICYILWNQGVKGKIWRLTKLLNENLTARIKTKYGLTRQIKRELGGKQGGRLMTTLFSKMTDSFEEEAQTNENLGITLNGKRLISFLWVDDVASIATEPHQQEALNFAHSFALKHKLEWGIEKCNVMQVGNHSSMEMEWKLGGGKIGNTNSYKYLGDIIEKSNKNKLNIESRMKRIKQTTSAIIACMKTRIMSNLSLQILINLHEIITIPTLLTNSESWYLNKTDFLNLERAELWTLKRIMNVPSTTPSVAIRFSTGTLYTKIRIKKNSSSSFKKYCNVIHNTHRTTYS